MVIDVKQRLASRVWLPDGYALDKIGNISIDMRPTVYLGEDTVEKVLVYAPEAWAAVFGLERISGEKWLSGT